MIHWKLEYWETDLGSMSLLTKAVKHIIGIDRHIEKLTISVKIMGLSVILVKFCAEEKNASTHF